MEKNKEIQSILNKMTLTSKGYDTNEALVVSELLAHHGYYIRSLDAISHVRVGIKDYSLIHVSVFEDRDVPEKSLADATIETLSGFDVDELEERAWDVEGFTIRYDSNVGLEGNDLKTHVGTLITESGLDEDEFLNGLLEALNRTMDFEVELPKDPPRVMGYDNNLYLDMDDDVLEGLEDGRYVLVESVDEELKSIIDTYHLCRPRCKEHNQSRRTVGKALADNGLLVVERPGLRDDNIILAKVVGEIPEWLKEYNESKLLAREAGDVWGALQGHLQSVKGMVVVDYKED